MAHILRSPSDVAQLLHNSNNDLSKVISLLLRPRSVKTSEVAISKQNYATLLFYLINPTDTRSLAEKLQSFYSLGHDSICGYVFKDGELVYHCVDCAVDNTCVFCQNCWNASDHVGHNFKYHRSGGGGVCDCGDAEAWNPKGFCKHHSGGIVQEGEEKEDPFEGVPQNVVDALNQFFPNVMKEIVKHVDRLYDGFVRPAMGTMTFSKEERIVISLHNDDWHTYEQVIAMVREIKGCNAEQAMQLTTQVDKLGALPVYTGTYEDALQKGFINNNGHTRQMKNLTSKQKQERKKEKGNKNKKNKQTKLMNSTLLYSVQPLSLWLRTNRVLGLLQFVDEMCTKSAACRTIVSRCMASTISTNYTVTPYDEDKNNINIRPKNVGMKRKAQKQGSREEKEDTEDTEDTEEMTKSMASASSLLSSVGLGMATEPLEEDVTVLERLLSRDIYFPKSCINGLHTLYTHLLSSPTFKTHFGNLYVKGYDSRCWNYCMGEGTEAESAHSLSVQILTTPSLVVSMMDHMHLSARLLSGVQLATCIASSTENTPLESEELIPKLFGHTSSIAYKSWCLHHKRYYHIVYDLLYVLRVGPKNLGALRFVVDSPTFLAGWMSILSHWSGRSPVKRQEGAHVQYESQDWVTTFNLFMLFKRITTILSRAVAAADVKYDGVDASKKSNHHMSSSNEELRLERLQKMNEELKVMRDNVRGNASLSKSIDYILSQSIEEDEGGSVMQKQNKASELNARYQSVGVGNIHACNDVDYWMNACLYGCDHPSMYQPSATRGLYGRTATLQCVNGIAASFFDGRSKPDAIEVVSSPLGTWHLFSFTISKRHVIIHHALHRMLGRIIRDHEATMYRTYGERGAKGRGCGQWLLGTDKKELMKSRTMTRTYTSKQLARDSQVACLRHTPKGKGITEQSFGGSNSSNSSNSSSGNDHLHWLLRLTLVEGPLRTCALMSQIRVGMWRRNGQSMNVMLNAYMTQASDCTYESDLNALMVGVVAVGSDHFLALLLEKFGVLPWLFGRSNVSGIKNDVWYKNEKYQEDMMEECLKLIIIMSNEAPKQQDNQHVPQEDHVDEDEDVQMKNASSTSSSNTSNTSFSNTNGDNVDIDSHTEFASLLRKNLIHKLLSKPRAPSILMKLGTNLAGGQDDFEHANTTSTVRDQLKNIAVLQRDESGNNGGATFELKDELFEEYDPYYIRLSSDEHFDAKERWLMKRKENQEKNQEKNQTTSQNANQTQVSSFRSSAPCVPSTLPFYDEVTSIFVTTQYVTLIRSLLVKLVIAKKANTIGFNDNLKDTLYHSLSMQCHILLTKPRSVQIRCMKAMCLKDPSEETLTYPSVVATYSVLNMLCLRAMELNQEEDGSASSGGMSEVELENLIWMLDIYHSIDSINHINSGTITDHLRPILLTLKSNEGQKQREEKHILQKQSSDRSKQQALSAMEEQQLKFAAMMEMDDSSSDEDDDSEDEDDDDDDDDDTDMKVKVVSLPSSSSSASMPLPGEFKSDNKNSSSSSSSSNSEKSVGQEVCIICNEGATSSSSSSNKEKGGYGYIGFAQADPKIYSIQNTATTEETQEDRQEYERKQNSTSSTSTSSTSTSSASTSSTSTSSTSTSSTGYNRSAASLSTTGESNVTVSPFLRFCSHGVHSNCLDEYRRTTRQKRNLGNQLELMHEFQCPLCKSLSNTHVPIAATTLLSNNAAATTKIESDDTKLNCSSCLSSIATTLNTLVVTTPDSSAVLKDEIDSYSVKKLKQELATHGVTNYDGMLEKNDFRIKLRSFTSPPPSTTLPPSLISLRSDSMAKVHELCVSIQTAVPLVAPLCSTTSPVPDEVYLMWRTCTRTAIACSSEDSETNVERNIISLQALLQCSKMSIQLVQDGIYIQDRLLNPIYQLLTDGFVHSTHSMLRDLLNLPQQETSMYNGITLYENEKNQLPMSNFNIYEKSIHVPVSSLLMVIVLFHPNISNVLFELCGEMIKLQIYQKYSFNSKQSISPYEMLEQKLNDNDVSTELYLLLRLCHLLLRCITKTNLPTLPKNIKKGNKQDIFNLIHHLQFKSILLEKSDFNTSNTSITSITLTTPLPFLYTLESEYGNRYDSLMLQIHEWMYECTQKKKQQVQDGEIDAKEADQIDQETPCMCLLCGKYLRGIEKVNGIGSCHRHVGMTPNGHRLNQTDVEICPVGRGGVGMFLLVDQTSILLVRKKWSVYWPSIYVDEYGEEDRNLKRGMPLKLSMSRVKQLYDMYESGKLANAVVGKRMHQDRVLRESWY